MYSIDDEAHAIICSDAETGDRIMQLNANRTGTIDQLSLSPDNQHLAAATEKGALIIDAETLAIVRTIQPNTATYSLAYSPDGRHLAIDGDNYIIRLLSIEQGYGQVAYGKGHHAEIWCIAFAPSRNLVVSLSDDESVIVWATPNMTMVYVLRGHISAADTAVFLSDHVLITGGDDCTIHFWDVDTGTFLQSIEQDDEVVALALSPSGKTYVFGCGKRLRVHDAFTYELVRETACVQEVCQISYADDDTLIAGFDASPMVAMDTWTGEVKATFIRHADISSVVVSSKCGGEYYADSHTHTSQAPAEPALACTHHLRVHCACL